MKLSESQLRSITNKELKKFFRLNELETNNYENETNNFGDNPKRPTPTEEFFMDVFVFLAKQPGKRAPIQAFSYKNQEEAKADGWNGPIGPYAISGQIRTVLYRELPYSFKIAPYVKDSVKDRYEQTYIYFDKVVEDYKDFITFTTMTLADRLKSKNIDENRRHRNRSQIMFPLHALRESKFRSIIAEEIHRLHEADDDTESQVSEMEGESRRIAVQELDQSLNEFMDKMSALGIAEEEACEELANIVKEFCEDKTSSAYEHQVTYKDEDDDSDDFDDGVYREFVDEFKAIIESGKEPEDSNFFKTAVRELGDEMARNALDDAITETDVGY